jgi:hypothetical protein
MDKQQEERLKLLNSLDVKQQQQLKNQLSTDRGERAGKKVAADASEERWKSSMPTTSRSSQSWFASLSCRLASARRFYIR